MASLRELYPIPDIDSCWTVPQGFEAAFDWDYDDGRKQMMHLYQKGKDMQWDALDRIDWSLELDTENPMQMPDEMSGIYHTPVWAKMSSAEQARHASPYAGMDDVAVYAGRASGAGLRGEDCPTGAGP